MIRVNSYHRSLAAENGALVKATPGVIYAARVAYLGSTSPMFLQFHDVTAVPADGEIPHLCYQIAGTWFDNFDPQKPWEFQNGIYVCLSTTAETKTIDTGDDGLFYIQYL